ncbi:MAG TPA: hypothetical protein DCL15_00110 [Chloroflexi bacterium]|nr:hypothetical protein [Chloroflexota bacterium]
MNQLRRTLRRPHSPTPLRFDRKAFYDLAAACRAYAAELANFDQDRVNLKECYRFNAWLAHLRRYDRLAPRIAAISMARPVARWQIVTLLVVVWVILALALPGIVNRQWYMVLLGGWLFTIVAAFFIPESLYGTTTELLEAKVLRVVDVLLEMLDSGTLEFSEAAFFKARENLLAAKAELRQQIDLAHRPHNGPVL